MRMPNGRNCPYCQESGHEVVTQERWNTDMQAYEYACASCFRVISEPDMDELWKQYWEYQNNLSAEQFRKLANKFK